MSKEFDKRFKELYDEHCDPGGSLDPDLWYSLISRVWHEIEAPRIIREAFYGKEKSKEESKEKDQKD